MPSKIHELSDHFDERNLFLQVALGIISWCGGFDRLIVEETRVGATASEIASQAEQTVLLLTLGCISLSRCAMRHFQNASVPVQEAGRAAQEVGVVPRRLLV